jgi:aspartyl-tRNA(Asn)/glutamyl-tRNA(Gln) amidotransferase subunit C
VTRKAGTVEVTRDHIRHLAELARLTFSDEEADALTRQMNQILEYFQSLRDVDTERVEPAFRTLRRQNVLRADEVGDMLSQEEAVANAPEEEDGLFRVPGTLPEA